MYAINLLFRKIHRSMYQFKVGLKVFLKKMVVLF